MCYRMSEISRHPVVAATRAFRFADHVTKRNEGSGNENGFELVDMLHFGNSIHEVFESAITGRYVYECSMSCNICLG